MIAMAIYHLSVKVISRANGSSALAAAAYRSASRLHDDRLDRDHNFSNKTGVVHSEVLLPENAPDEWHDRERLWNDVEAVELRKDAQLAREVEFAIPREMTKEQGIELARDFVSAEFVDAGMVADLNVHWDIGADGEPKPHAHVMLSMRDVTDEGGFGAKVRDWNRTELVERWRERWAEHVNQRLAELDIDARIDHRSFKDRGIDLEPQGKIGAPAQRMERDGQLAERAEIHREIARDNGARIIADPSLGLDQITHGQATFTRRDMAMMAHRHSDGVEQFNEVMGAMRGAPELVALGVDGRGEERFTTREMIETEQRLEQAARMMAEREHHRVADRDRERALARAVERELVLSGEQADALAHVTQGPDLGVVVGYAGTGKSAMLGIAREAWEDAGFNVRGAALSGIAAEGLENGSGIGSRTIASLEHQWAHGRDLLTANDVLVIDEAGMVGTRQMERVLGHAAEAGAKVVLVGDPEQLQAIEAGAAFRAIHERHGGGEITEVRRQRVDWQRDATRHLATGRTGEALQAYGDHGMVHAAGSRDEARKDLIDRWDRDRQARPDHSRIILTHTNEEVGELNAAARERMREMGGLGDDVRLTVNRGERDFARGDRILFLRNEHGLGVKNGTLGTIEEVSRTGMAVRTDTGRPVSFDHKDYADVDHGYAATIHKTQSMTVDRVHVLATPGMDAHASYVALSRHRDRVDVHYGGDDFADRERLTRTLSRDRAKDMASDYDRVDPERAFAERRGITFRERVAEVAQEVAGKVRGMFDGLRLTVAPLAGERAQAAPVPGHAPELGRTPDDDPDKEARRTRSNALRRHARAYDAVFGASGNATPGQLRELDDARAAFDKVRPFGVHDAEAAYAKDPSIAVDVSQGLADRINKAIRLEGELRTLDERGDLFVKRWRALETASLRQYELGDMDAYKATQRRMGDMAMGLQRDPQLESVLAIRKAELGITISSGRSLGAELAYNHGIDIGLGRGRGLGL